MSFLQGSSNFVIQDGQFTNIQGSQHITHFHGSYEYQKGNSLIENFKRIRTGDIYLVKQIDSASVQAGPGRWGVVACRTLSVAEVSGENKDRKFTHVGYDGPNALEAFKRDFAQFSRVKHPNIIQLFGYNDSELPGLVFYDELIPLYRVLIQKDGICPILNTYFNYQFDMTWQSAGVQFDMAELWIEPRTGALRRGLFTEIPGYIYWFFGGFHSDLPDSDRFLPLPIQTYSDTRTVLDFLHGRLPTGWIIRGISWSGGTYRIEEELHSLHSLPGTVFHGRSKNVITQWTGSRESWYYEFFKVAGDIPDAMKESQVVMKDNFVRFTVTPVDIQQAKGMSVWYLVHTDQMYMFMELWLTQAHSVFRQLQVPEHMWHEYAIPAGVWFDFEFLHSEEQAPECVTSPVYLFIRPIPASHDDETIWASWVEGTKYFWS